MIVIMVFFQEQKKWWGVEVRAWKWGVDTTVRQIQAVLSDPKHRVKKGIKTEDEQLMNDEFARIAKEMEIADKYEE